MAAHVLENRVQSSKPHTFHSTRRSGQPECFVKRVSEGSPRFRVALCAIYQLALSPHPLPLSPLLFSPLFLPFLSVLLARFFVFKRGGNRMKSTSPTIRLGAKADKEELYEGSYSYTITHGADTSLGRVQREEVPISSDDTNDHAIDYELPQEVYWAHARMLHSTTPTRLHGTVDARGSATTTANPARMNTTTTMNTTPTTMFTTLAQKNGRMNNCWRGRERSDSSCTSSTVTTTDEAISEEADDGVGGSGSERAISTRSNSQSSFAGCDSYRDDESIADPYTYTDQRHLEGDELITVEDDSMLTVQEISWDEETEREDRYRLNATSISRESTQTISHLQRSIRLFRVVTLLPHILLAFYVGSPRYIIQCITLSAAYLGLQWYLVIMQTRRDIRLGITSHLAWKVARSGATWTGSLMLLGALMEWCITESPITTELEPEKKPRGVSKGHGARIAELISSVAGTLKRLLLWSLALTSGILFCGFYTSLDRDDPFMLLMVAFAAFSIPPTVATMTQRLYRVVLVASRFRQTTINNSTSYFSRSKEYTLTCVVTTSLTLPLDMLAYVMEGIATSAYLMLWNDVDAHQIFVCAIHLLHRYHWNRV